MRVTAHKKRAVLWKEQTWMLQHDNASAHTLLLVVDCLAKIVLPYPLYFSDLAAADFFFFPKSKATLKGNHFKTIEIKKKSTPKSPFQELFQNLKHWKLCTASRGEYVKGDMYV